MPTRRRVGRRGSLELADCYLDLLIGPTMANDDGPDGRPRFLPSDPASAAARNRARIAALEPVYWRNREELLGAVNLGTRPWAWWAFEAPPQSTTGRTHRYEAARLAAMGVLTPEEIAHLRADSLLGGPYRAEWEEAAEVLGLDPWASQNR
jgi:hypothetical protein